MKASREASTWLAIICVLILAALISGIIFKKTVLDPLSEKKKYTLADLLEQEQTENQKIISQHQKEYRESQIYSRDLQQQQRETMRRSQDQRRSAQQQLRAAQQQAREAQRALKAN